MPAGTPEDPFIVGDVFEEYSILKELGLARLRQSLREVDGKPYDVLVVLDPASGEEREVWFDISRFFGKRG